MMKVQGRNLKLNPSFSVLYIALRHAGREPALDPEKLRSRHLTKTLGFRNLIVRLANSLLWYIGGTMEEKITIIEGPPPVFEAVNDGWALGLNEGSRLSVPALTRLRTYNGPALVERCYRAWNSQSPIHLHYRNEMGVEQSAPILAARNVETA